MKKTLGIGLLLVAVTFALSGCYGRPVVHGHGSVVIHDGSSRVAVVFSDGDRRHIHNYYEERYQKRHHHKGKKGRKGLPPGLAKRDRRPPGFAKRDHLPKGHGGQRLPHELGRRLSRLPAGVIRVRIGTELVLMDEHTRVVLDVIKDIPLD
ncbi:MAG TPA: hypothetical protein ENH92_01670 [Ectothiorhodospiraceae bacterium]|nr:hypothetical protein [Ectothiorhodospiraceae bacterium]